MWSVRHTATPSTSYRETITRPFGLTISPGGLGGHDALCLFRDELMPACRAMDDPLNLA